MEFKDQQKEAYQRAAAMCSRAEKSSGGILRKLIEWGISDEEAQQVLDRLIEEKFIDDERFTKSYVQDKFKFNKWGKIKISYQLRFDKIAPSVIDDALDKIDDSVYRAVLFDLIMAKNKNIKSPNQFDRKAKLFRFAQGRGFEADLISSVVDEVLNH